MLAQVQTRENLDFVKTRIRNVDSKSSEVALVVDDQRHTIDLGPLEGEKTRFLASIVTYKDPDPCELRRWGDATNSSLEILVEEDKTLGNETEHGKEAVAYLAVQGDGDLQACSVPVERTAAIGRPSRSKA